MEEKEEKEEIVEKEEKETEPTPEKKSHGSSPVIIPVLVAIIVLLIGGIVVVGLMRNKTNDNTPTEEKEKETEEETIKEKETKEETESEESKEETPKEETKVGDPVLAVGKYDGIALFDDNANLVWEYTPKESIRYGDISVVDNYVYFAEKNSLFRANIQTKEVENLSITLQEPWHLWVEGNQLVYSSLFEVHTVDLNSKKDTKLAIENENKDVVINGVYYYTKKDAKSLCAYNLKTNENKVIDSSARITTTYNNSFIYVNEDNKYYLYNTKDESKTLIMTGGEYAFSAGTNDANTLYNNEMYIVIDNVLYTIREDKKKELYKFELNTDESITEITAFKNNKFFVTKYIDNGPPCTSDVCGPTGDNVYYLFNLNTKKLKEIKASDWFNSTYDYEIIG